MPILGYGGAALPKAWHNPLSQEQRVELVRYAYDRGVRYFDTSPVYMESEAILGKALKDRRRDLCRVTKVESTEPQEVRKSVRKSLNTLQPDHLDLILIHGTPGLQQMTVPQAMKIHAELARLRDEKVTRFTRGVISAISRSASRALGYLETDRAIDASRVAIMGHSKCGKAALWAAAQDQRFALAISAQSGHPGAALNRRKSGDTLEKMVTRFPYWLCRNAWRFANNEDDLPVDQHMLLACIAPRPLYIMSAVDDNLGGPAGRIPVRLSRERDVSIAG